MIVNSLTQLPLHQLKKAIGIRERIEDLTFELNQLLQVPTFSNGDAIVVKGRGLSAAGRAKIAAAQRLRWSRHNAGKTSRTKKTIPRKQRLSPAGRARVAAAVKARWERFRAAKAKALRT